VGLEEKCCCSGRDFQRSFCGSLTKRGGDLRYFLRGWIFGEAQQENIGGCGRDRTGDPLLAKRKPRIPVPKPMPLILNSLFFNADFSSC